MEINDSSILRFDNLLSTNSYLKEHIGEFLPYTTIWSDGQEKGRGRYNREWISYKGKDLTFSILIPLKDLKIEYWKNLTQISSLSIAEELEKLDFKVSIKWPNDILINDKKVCGLLCEVSQRGDEKFAVLGIGLNVNSTLEDLSNINQPATSLFIEKGTVIDREELLQNIVSSNISKFNDFTKNGFQIYKKEVLRRLAWLNEIKIIEDNDRSFDGRIIDLNDDGTLKFLKSDGEIINLISGEIRFKKGH